MLLNSELMHNKILIISGPTATGKTALAVDLAKKLNGELVSTDSCQLYRGMDIGTGKDQPDETPIHLIDIINPDQKFSVSQFKKIALVTIHEIQSRNKLPILVGCSGFYTDSIINPSYETFVIKQNKLLRIFLNKFSVKLLQKIYKFLDKKNFEILNNSDRNNPHRLIRKIEIKLSNISPLHRGSLDPRRGEMSHSNGTEGFNTLHISLTAPMQFLYDRIDKRVHSRMEEGFLKEIKNLLKKYKWSDPGMQIGAYQCLKPYFENKDVETLRATSLQNTRATSLHLNACLQKWKYAEHSDARRQSTFFRNKSNAIFFDITDSNFPKKTISTVLKWYNK